MIFKPHHTFVIAEIGINHNGSLDMARQLVDAAADAGADCAKFQIRTPHMSLPPELWNQERDTPWGRRMTYLEYRQMIELTPGDLQAVVLRCKEREIMFSASPWDINAVGKLYHLGVPFIKIASASVTNLPLVRHIASMKKPVVMSTGMCSEAEVDRAVGELQAAGVPEIGLLVCTSTYPAKVEDLNLLRIYTLQEKFPDCVVGYSGHESGLWTTVGAAYMGARIIERHLTLDRSLPGSDQAASVEPGGFKLLVREIRNIEKAMGNGDLRMLESEEATAKRLRGSNPITGATQEPKVLH